MNLQQAEQYLERIGCDFTAPDAKNLAVLQRAHLETVPYENLDILNGIRISLAEEVLFDKIVKRHRGGYCFEVNRLFGELLRTLGYQVFDMPSRYLRGETGLPMYRHHVLRVGADDGVFFCDVGVGEPIPMEPPVFRSQEVFEDSVGQRYFFREDPVFGAVLCEYYRGAARDVMSTQEDLWGQADFETVSFWCEFSPDSPFNKGRICAIRTPDGRRITLNGNVLHTFCGMEVSEITIPEEEIGRTLWKLFGIQ